MGLNNVYLWPGSESLQEAAIEGRITKRVDFKSQFIKFFYLYNR